MGLLEGKGVGDPGPKVGRLVGKKAAPEITTVPPQDKFPKQPCLTV